MKKIVFIIIALIILVGGFLIFNNSNIFNSNKVDENSIVGKIEYNATINSDWNEIEALKTLSEDIFFYEIDESNNYDFNGDVLTVSNGVVSVSGEDNFNAKIKDVYKMYLVIGDYNHQYAFLTKSGDVYVGANLITYKNEDYGLVSEKEFNKLYKVNSNNKYKELRLLEITNNPEWTSDDRIEYHLIGITKDNKKDIIRLNYDNM